MNCVIVERVRNSRKMFAGNIFHENGQGQSKIQIQIQIQSQISPTVTKRQKTMKSNENQLTIMLLLVTMLFMILMIPTYLRFISTNFANYISLILFFYVSN